MDSSVRDGPDAVGETFASAPEHVATTNRPHTTGVAPSRPQATITDRTANFRLGIAGPPGAGKSTFIESLGLYLVSLGHRVAVLAVDPSSQRTGGSILGDKTRMEQLSRSPDAYVRPSPSRGCLGGVSLNTNEAILLCEAAGFDVVIVETVGVGQSETEVDNAADCMMLLVPPASGDELQGVKKGIVEMADLVVVNKSDGELVPAARSAASDLRRALRLVRPKLEGWTPPVARCSALLGEGVPEVWAEVCAFVQRSRTVGRFERRREEQSREWLWTQLHAQLWHRLRADGALKQLVAGKADALSARRATAREAARDALDDWLAVDRR
jgi:LAO/AO transport system kinase